MSNREFEVILNQGLAVKVSATARNVHSVILYRYDGRPTLESGKPNPGYKKSYPGMDLLVRSTGVSRQSVERAISELIENNIIDQVTLAKPRVRAEYRPIYALSLLGERVDLSLHISKIGGSSKRKKSVAPGTQMSKASDQNESGPRSTISTTRNHKYDSKQMNEERWKTILNYLGGEVRIHLKPGSNYETRLDKLERQGITPNAVGEFMAGQKWSTAYKIGGLFEALLDKLLGLQRASSSWSIPRNCGKCDPLTRQLEDQCVGEDGKLTHECRSCHPNQVRLRARLAEPRKPGVLAAPSGPKVISTSVKRFDLESVFRSINE